MIAPVRPLRIALVADHYPPRTGGIELHVQALAHRLADRGHDVHVLTTTPGAARDRTVSVHRIDVPLVPLWQIAYTPIGIHRLETMLRGFDVVHAHHSVFSPAAACALFLAQRSRMPAVATFHSILRGYMPALVLLDRLTSWTSWRVAFSAVSEHVARDLRSLLPGAPIPILGNGVDAADWHVPESTIASDVVHVVTTLRLAPRKRPRAFVEMIAQLRALLPLNMKLRVSIIGDGPERRGIERRIRALGLEDVVSLMGRQQTDVLRATYASASFFVLPTIEESFGRAALEARCAGLPIIGMREAGIAAFIRNGVDGLLADDDAGMVSHMLRLATDTALRERIETHNRETPPPFQWDDVLETHEHAYHDSMTAH